MFEFSIGFRPAPRPKCCCICHAHSGVLCCAEGQPLKQRAAACCQLCCLVATQGCCLLRFQPLPLAHVTCSVGCGSMLLSVAGHMYITTCSLHHCDMLTTHERPPQPSTAGGEHAVTHASFSCRSLFATLTRGSGMLHRAFQSYGHYKGPLDKVRKGVLISMAG